MSLAKIGNVRINPTLCAIGQYWDGRGVGATGPNGKMVAFAAEEDPIKGLELMKELLQAVKSVDNENNIIELNNHAFIDKKMIGVISIAPEKAVVINNNEGEVIYWLEESNTEKADLICEEINKAYDAAGTPKPYVIDWPSLMNE